MTRFRGLRSQSRLLAALVLGAGVAMAPAASADPLTEGFAAVNTGDCATAIPLFEQVRAAPETRLREIEASHALALCHAGGEESWRAREIMAELLPKVLQEFGPASPGLARHHAIWSEAEVRAGALNVAWRRSEAAIGAQRAAGALDPYDHAAEIFRLAAIQIARGEAGAFLAFLDKERQMLALADWAAPGDDALFAEVVPEAPAGDEAALGDWARAGLEELDPRPLYLDLLNRSEG